MAEPLALVSELERRLRVEVGSLTGTDLQAAEDALSDASVLVRAAARDAGLAEPWTAFTAPEEVRLVVVRVAKRQYENPSGYVSEAMGGGAYSYRLADDETSAYLTAAEAATISAAVAASGPAGASQGFTGSLRTPLAYEREVPVSLNPWFVPGEGG